MSVKRILIIDNEEEICKVVKAGLEKMGDYRVDMALNGKKGIELAREIKPDLILLDVMMPEMDGFEVIKRLKAERDTVTIPVVMLSGLDDDTTKIKGAQLMNEQYITKPAAISDLKDKIDDVLNRRGNAR
ncbi:PleD family two-component system response regulator [Candidatus Omnitrophota bacterium]